MATTAEVRQLLLRVDASTQLATRKLNELDKDVGKGAERIERHLGKIEKASAGASRALKGLGAGALAFVGLSSIKGALELADAYTSVQSKLMLATRETGSFMQAQADVMRIAQATRAPLAATAELYAAMSRNAAELGASQAQVARATETVNKASRVSGASAQATEAAITQLGQALASGVLRGDEFNSIAEQAPRLQKLFADSLGVSIGELRTLSQQGLLTSDKLLEALTDKKFTEGLDAEFRAMPVTFGEAVTQIFNSAQTVFGEFDQGGQFSQSIANFVSEGSEGFADLAKDSRDSGAVTRAVFEGLGNVWEPFKRAGSEALGLIGFKIVPIRNQIRDILGIVDSLTKTGGIAAVGKAASLHNYGVSRMVANGYNVGGLRVPEWGGTNLAERFTSGYDQSYDAYRRRESERIIAEVMRTPLASDGEGEKPAPAVKPDAKAIAAAKRLAAQQEREAVRQAREAERQRQFTSEMDGDRASAVIRTVERLSSTAFADAYGDNIFQKMTDDARRAIEAVTDLTAERLADVERAAAQLNWSIAEGLSDAIVYGQNLGDVLVNSLKRAAAEALSSGLFTILSGGNIGKSGGGVGGFLSKAFGGFYAEGGSPPVGKVSVVGEKGPELFIPKVPGIIVPNHALGGGGSGGTSVNITVNAPGATAETVALIQREVMALAPVLVKAATGNTLRAANRPKLPGGLR